MRLIHHPVLCNYYVTYRCNASCSFCDIWEKPSPYVTLENVSANLRDLKEMGVKVVDFTGGEPLLHRQLPEFLDMAKSLGMMTTVTTNGLLYPKYAQKLRGKIDMLHFSLDSPVEEEHNASRNVKCFDKVMESIAIARQLGERPDILFTVQAGNVHQVQQVYDEITRPNNLVLILNPIFAYNEVGSELSAADLQALRQWAGKKNVYLNQAFLTLREQGGNQANAPVCKAASSTIVISPENKLILPCYHLGLDALPINNNLLALRESETVKQAIDMEGRYEGCQGCTVNCYMQPSFAVELNAYFWESLKGTLKYSWEKQIWKRLAVSA